MYVSFYPLAQNTILPLRFYAVRTYVYLILDLIVLSNALYFFIITSHVEGVYIPNYVATCNSCNTGTSALPDMYARRPRASVDISGNARVPVLQLICYTYGTLKICPNLLLTALPIYIAKDSHCDYGILILTFL